MPHPRQDAGGLDTILGRHNQQVQEATQFAAPQAGMPPMPSLPQALPPGRSPRLMRPPGLDLQRIRAQRTQRQESLRQKIRQRRGY